MQIDTSTTVAVTRHVDADITRMTLDPDGLAHLTQVLTNLYADKHLAVLREYATNALDSHVAAGNQNPIEVTLPGPLNPTLVVTDHGVGLSRDDIVNVYARYGASTKRGTNTMVGSFGLGAKSAFTIGGQFVVTATKDGQRTVAVFALDEHGVGTVNILAEHAVDEPDGVTVSVAVSDTGLMGAAADRFFRAWRPGTVLVDGRQPPSIFDDGPWLGDDVLFTGADGITVVMGNVAYPLPDSALPVVRARCGGSWAAGPGSGSPGLVVVLPIGSVDITPSREAVRDTDRTIDAVAAVLSNLTQRVHDELSRRITAAGSTVAAVLAGLPVRKAAGHLGVHGLSSHTWQGQPVDDLDLPDATRYGLSQRGALTSSQFAPSPLALTEQVTVLVGVPRGRSAARQAKQWVQANPGRVLLRFGDGHATAGRSGWFEWGGDSPVPTMHFDSIELPAAAPSKSRSRVVYDVVDVDTSTMSAMSAMSVDDLNGADRPVAYTDHIPGYGHWRIWFTHALAGHLVIRLRGGQSEAALTRRVPAATHAQMIMQRWFDRRTQTVGDLNTLTEVLQEATAFRPVLRALGPDRAARITHPTFRAAADADARWSALSPVDQAVVHTHAGYIGSGSALTRDLPLLARAAQFGHDPRALDHLVLYANAAAPVTD